ncbi:hypothetical protein D918_01750 [Trichuris suis]|nr:hypothetical protein D918_01750 [Trichuris suis]
MLNALQSHVNSNSGYSSSSSLACRSRFFGSVAESYGCCISCVGSLFTREIELHRKDIPQNQAYLRVADLLRCSNMNMDKPALPNNMFMSPPPGYRKMTCSDEVAKRLLEEKRHRSLPLVRLNVLKCHRTQYQSLTYEDVTPMSRLARLPLKKQTRVVQCQTIYSFPVDFDLGIFFGLPYFLHLDDEVDVAIMKATKADGDETELRLKLYSNDNNGESVKMMRKSEIFSESSICTHQSDITGSVRSGSPSALESLVREALSSLAANFNDVSPDGSFIIDDEEICEQIRRSSWNGEVCPISPALSPIEGISANAFDGRTEESDRSWEEHLSRADLSLSHVVAVNETASFGYIGKNGNQMGEEEEECNNTDWQYCAHSTFEWNRQATVEVNGPVHLAISCEGEKAAATFSFIDITPPMKEVLEISMKSISFSESANAALGDGK